MIPACRIHNDLSSATLVDTHEQDSERRIERIGCLCNKLKTITFPARECLIAAGTDERIAKGLAGDKRVALWTNHQRCLISGHGYLRKGKTSTQQLALS